MVTEINNHFKNRANLGMAICTFTPNLTAQNLGDSATYQWLNA